MNFYKLHSFFSEPEPVQQKCMREGCQTPGEYKAPKSPAFLHDYYWFCLDHVREYNASWNYYEHMDADEIETSRREDFTWERITRPFGNGHGFSSRLFQDVHGVFQEDMDMGSARGEVSPFGAQTPHAKALIIMDLSYPFTLEELKIRYKILAKRHHPDLNHGCRLAEDRLKDINQAYALLKKFLDVCGVL